MPRSKTPTMVCEKIVPRQQESSSNILTDDSNINAEYRFLRLLDMKRRMSIISEADYQALTTSAHGSATEKASIEIFKNLNKYSEFDSRLKQISDRWQLKQIPGLENAC